MSTSQLLRRVIAMDRRELWFRAVTAGRREAARVAYLARRPQWRRTALARALHPDDRSLRDTFAALRRSDWTGAHDALMRHFATRPARFILDPASRVERTALIVRQHPEAVAEAAARADRIVAGQFDLLGYRNLSFSNGSRRSEIDWHLDPVNQRRAASDYWSRISVSRRLVRRPQGRLGTESAPVMAAAWPRLLVDRRPSLPRGLHHAVRWLDAQQPAAPRDELGQHAGTGVSLPVLDLGAALFFRDRRTARRRNARRGLSISCLGSTVSSRRSSATCRPTSARTRISLERRWRSMSRDERCQNCAGPRDGKRRGRAVLIAQISQADAR